MLSRIFEVALRVRRTRKPEETAQNLKGNASKWSNGHLQKNQGKSFQYSPIPDLLKCCSVFLPSSDATRKELCSFRLVSFKCFAKCFFQSSLEDFFAFR